MTLLRLLVLVGAATFIPATAHAQQVETQNRVGLKPLSAKQVYVETWDATHKLFGAPRRPMPRLVRDRRHQPGNLAFVTGGADGFREIHVGDGVWERLSGDRGSRGRLIGRVTLVHEFAHVYQNAGVFIGETVAVPAPDHEPWWGPIGPEHFYEGIPEGGAEAFAEWAVWSVWGIPLQSYGGNYEWKSEGYVEEIREDLPWWFLRRGQFSENWGGNPRAIPWVAGISGAG